MVIVITGSNGFVGKNLVSYPIKDKNKQIVLINRDELQVLSSIPFDRIDCFIHLAGKAHDLKKSSNPDEYYTVNFELTKKLYDAFLNQKLRNLFS
jgi:nucleoside-diphosphate-sugar epimerase